MVQLMPLPPPSSLAILKTRMVKPFWCQLTLVVLEKKPLHGRLSQVLHSYGQQQGHEAKAQKPMSLCVLTYLFIYLTVRQQMTVYITLATASSKSS